MATLISSLICYLAYFLPSIIAFRRKLPNTRKIFLINLILGWTVIGWFAALILASSGKKQWIAVLGSFLAIVALLAMIAMPGLLSSRRFHNNKIAKDNLRALSVVLEEYAQENSGAYPPDINTLKSSKPRQYVDICDKDTPGHTYRCFFSFEGYRIIAVGKPALEGFSTFTIETGGKLTEEKPSRPK